MLVIILQVLLLNVYNNSKGNQVSHEINLIQKFDTINPEIICPMEIEARPDQEEWVAFLQNNLQLDSAALDTIPTGRFTVIAQFAIDKDGKIEEISIAKEPGYGLGERVKKMLNNYHGCWQPAILNGRETKSYRRQPITFIVEEETENNCEENRTTELIP